MAQQLSVLLHASDGSSCPFDARSRAGAICIAGFDAKAAQVACRELGLAGGQVARYARGTAPFLVTNLKCEASSGSLAGCQFTLATACPQGSAAGVICASERRRLPLRREPPCRGLRALVLAATRGLPACSCLPVRFISQHFCLPSACRSAGGRRYSGWQLF